MFLAIYLPFMYCLYSGSGIDLRQNLDKINIHAAILFENPDSIKIGCPGKMIPRRYCPENMISPRPIENLFSPKTYFYTVSQVHNVVNEMVTKVTTVWGGQLKERFCNMFF